MTSGWGDLWITMTRAQLSRTVTSPPLEKLKLSSASCSAPQRLHLMMRDIPSVPFFGYSDTTCHMHQQSSPAQERKADAVTLARLESNGRAVSIAGEHLVGGEPVGVHAVRSPQATTGDDHLPPAGKVVHPVPPLVVVAGQSRSRAFTSRVVQDQAAIVDARLCRAGRVPAVRDRKSTRLNSSH